MELLKLETCLACLHTLAADSMVEQAEGPFCLMHQLLLSLSSSALNRAHRQVELGLQCCIQVHSSSGFPWDLAKDLRLHGAAILQLYSGGKTTTWDFLGFIIYNKHDAKGIEPVKIRNALKLEANLMLTVSYFGAFKISGFYIMIHN